VPSLITNIQLFLIATIAKVLYYSIRLIGLGGGTSLPGIIVEKYFPSILSSINKNLDQIIIISGTNGKTTTRALLVSIYESMGVPVCTNRGGANIMRGIATSLLLNLNWKNQPRSRTVILEVEEATLPILTKYLPADQIILTNIFRDQLDAYGEIDSTLEFFREAIYNSRIIKGDKVQVVANLDDTKLLTALDQFQIPIIGFGVSDNNYPRPNFETTELRPVVKIKSRFVAQNIVFKPLKSTFIINASGVEIAINARLLGIYNIYNIAAAVAASFAKFDQKIIPAISKFQPVFGRGEVINTGTNSLQLFLVKNPAGFAQTLDLINSNPGSSTSKALVIKDSKPRPKPKKDPKTPKLNLAIFINDDIADGRDVSWLWDTQFENYNLELNFDTIYTSGSRGLDMLLRLEYAGFQVESSNYEMYTSNLIKKILESNQDFVICATYTAMLELRGYLQHKFKLNKISDRGY